MFLRGPKSLCYFTVIREEIDVKRIFGRALLACHLRDCQAVVFAGVPVQSQWRQSEPAAARAERRAESAARPINQ